MFCMRLSLRLAWIWFISAVTDINVYDSIDCIHLLVFLACVNVNYSCLFLFLLFFFLIGEWFDNNFDLKFSWNLNDIFVLVLIVLPSLWWTVDTINQFCRTCDFFLCLCSECFTNISRYSLYQLNLKYSWFLE